MAKNKFSLNILQSLFAIGAIVHLYIEFLINSEELQLSKLIKSCNGIIVCRLRSQYTQIYS